MEKTIKFSGDYKNYPAYNVSFNRSVKSPLSPNQFIVPWQLEETKEEKKMQNRIL